MAPQVFEDDYFDYIEDRLRIVSGFYGILKPFDGVVPYRLEMQAKLKTAFCHNVVDQLLIVGDLEPAHNASRPTHPLQPQFVVERIFYCDTLKGKLQECDKNDKK